MVKADKLLASIARQRLRSGGRGPGASRYFITNDWTTLKKLTPDDLTAQRAAGPMTPAKVAKFGVGSNDFTLFVNGKPAEKIHGSTREQSRRALARKSKQLEALSSGVMTRAQAREKITKSSVLPRRKNANK